MTRRRSKPVLSIVPLARVGPIEFGQKRADVRSAMAELGLGLSSSTRSQDFFGAQSSIQVEYVKGTTSFVGISNGDDFACTLYEIDPFDTAAKDLFALLARKDGVKGARFTKDEHCFRNLIATLYEADPQYDRRRSSKRAIWGQVGVGDARYLAAIDAID